MERNTTPTDSRTESKRHTGAFDGKDLIEGDRISPDLVAKTEGQYGQAIKPTHPEGETAPKTQLVAITDINGMSDVHSAILADPESGVMVRASCHDSQSAWSQKERDWKVHAVGTTPSITDVSELEVTDNDTPVENDVKWVQGWADVVLMDKANGHFGYSDEVSISGTTISFRDIEGRRATASYTLED